MKIAELEAKVTRIESDLEVLERRILSLEAREAMRLSTPPRELTQHEYVEQQRARDRYSAWAQHQMQAQQGQQALQNQQNYQAGLAQPAQQMMQQNFALRSQVPRP